MIEISTVNVGFSEVKSKICLSQWKFKNIIQKLLYLKRVTCNRLVQRSKINPIRRWSNLQLVQYAVGPIRS